jgi:hypothetical protein
VLVTNGRLNDTARLTLNGYIQGWEGRGFPKLQVELRDSLLRDFVDLHGRYLPTQLADVEHLLRFYTRDGVAPLPRGEFAEFVASNVPLGDLSKRLTKREPRRKVKRVKPSARDVERHLASTALLVSYALYPFMAAKNFWSEFEGWIIFCAHILAVAERLELPDQTWLPTFDLAWLAAHTALKALIHEAVDRDQWHEGGAMVDSYVYRARMTIVLGLMALHSIICRVRNEPDSLESQIARFVNDHRHELHMWGETAVPYLSLIALYIEARSSARVGESLLGMMLVELVHQNRPREDGAPDTSLADPYLEIDEAISWSIGVRHEPEWDRPSYDGRAYTLRALVMLLARRLRRRLLAANWHAITDVNYVEMFPGPVWAMLLWRSPVGDLKITLPRRPQSWSQLLEEARSINADGIPPRLQERPDFLAAFITVFPHRLRADTLKVIDESL